MLVSSNSICRTCPETLTWGSRGFEDARRWPLLPLGTMMAGDPIPDLDPRGLWIILFCKMTVPIPNFADTLSRGHEKTREDEEICSDPLQDICFALDLEKKPEKEWSRYENRRMRTLAQRISRLPR